MKVFLLFISRDKDYYSAPTALKGWTGKQYGTAMWNPDATKQVCRVPFEQWNQAMEEDIAKLSHLPGNMWLRGLEFECADGTRFASLDKAVAHEGNPEPQPASVVPSGIPVSREFVERAGAEQLRDIAKAVKMPEYRKLPKSDELRPALLEYLGYTVEPKQAEAV